MKNDNITYLTDVVLITCVINHGREDEVLEFAREVGLNGGFVYHARGNGPRERLGIWGIAIEAEKDVSLQLTIVKWSASPLYKAGSG